MDKIYKNMIFRDKIMYLNIKNLIRSSKEIYIFMGHDFHISFVKDEHTSMIYDKKDFFKLVYDRHKNIIYRSTGYFLKSHFNYIAIATVTSEGRMRIMDHTEKLKYSSSKYFKYKSKYPIGYYKTEKSKHEFVTQGADYGNEGNIENISNYDYFINFGKTTSMK
jgi:ribosomal protein S4E